MPTTCETYLSQIDSDYANADSWYDTGHVYEQWLLSHSVSTFNQTYRDNIIGFVGAVDAMLQSLIHCNPGYTTPLRIPYYLRNCVGGGSVDMDAILNAMLVSSFDQLQKFIGIEDAYRVALWNAPFNADFYAALARGFQQWP